MTWGSNTIKKFADTEPLLRGISRLMSEDRWESNRNKNVWGGAKRQESLKTHVHLTRARVGREVTAALSRDASASCYFGDVMPANQSSEMRDIQGTCRACQLLPGMEKQNCLVFSSPRLSGRCRVASRPEWQKEEPNVWNERSWLLAEGGADGRLPRGYCFSPGTWSWRRGFGRARW